MIQMQTTRHKKSRRHLPLRTDSPQQGIFLFLSLFFLFGAIVGALVGALSEAGDLSDLMKALSTGAGDWNSFLRALWDATWFHLLVLVAGTSLLGLLFVPLLTAARGYLLSCTAAAVLQSYPWNTVLVLLGIPALFEIPSFLVLAADAIRISRRLAAAAGGAFPAGERDNPILRHTLICLLILTVSAAVKTFILPILLANCIS